MTTRGLTTFVLCLTGLSVAGCANDRSGNWGAMQHLGAAPLNVLGSAQASTTTAAVAATEPPVTMKKTLGGKVLSAMALERATGRKPDPSRLNELD